MDNILTLLSTIDIGRTAVLIMCLLFALFRIILTRTVHVKIKYWYLDSNQKWKQAKLGQFSIYRIKTGHYVHHNWTYRMFRPLHCTVIPSDSLKKESLCFKIVLGQAWFELYCALIFFFCTHSTWTQIGHSSPP